MTLNWSQLVLLGLLRCKSAPPFALAYNGSGYVVGSGEVAAQSRRCCGRSGADRACSVWNIVSRKRGKGPAVVPGTRGGKGLFTQVSAASTAGII